MEDESSISYLRPETAQGMFVNFKNIVDTMHPKLPFGMAQIGKAFRNEISPRDFIFRLRELEQMEIEYFVDPRDEKKVNEMIEALHGEQLEFLSQLGLDKSRIHKVEIPEADRAHYSKRSIDTEFDFPFGQKELLGLAYRTDYDLKAHSEASGTDLSYFDEETKTRLVPHCIEPTFGLDRLTLAVLSQAYCEDELAGEKRIFLKLAPSVAPIKVAIFPLLKNKEAITSKAQDIYKVLKKEFGAVEYDASGSIGKRYRRQDEIGTPFCVTIDFDTIEKNGSPVTVRDRDTGEQQKVELEELSSYLAQKLGR
jgi:glycyl-tRNA synthetase